MPLLKAGFKDAKDRTPALNAVLLKSAYVIPCSSEADWETIGQEIKPELRLEVELRASELIADFWLLAAIPFVAFEKVFETDLTDWPIWPIL
jgi:hypothetical protein